MSKKLLLLLAVLLFPILGFAQNLNNDLSNSFKTVKLIKINPADTVQKLNGRQTIQIGDFSLNLTPRDLRSPRYKAEETNKNGVTLLEKNIVSTYKGTVADKTDSQVRLTINQNKIEGFISANKEIFYIEPAIKHSKFATKNDFVIYRAEDLIKTETFSCPTDIIEKIERGKDFLSNQVTPNGLSVRVIEIATDADFEYVQDFGGSAQANNDILSTLNMVEGVYEQELSLTFDVVFQHTWAEPDPYPNTNTTAMLNAFKAHWNVSYSGITRDTAHLWSAKTSALSQGIAFLGVICSAPQSTYGITGKLDLVPTKYILTAHEIGHNLGANHAGTFQITPTQECDNTSMNEVLSNITPFTFCSFSRSEISGYVAANNSCLAQRNLVPTKFDFDGDNKADISVFRPENGAWYINKSSDNSFFAFQFGQNGDKIVPADYDGDGKTDAAVYRNGVWYRLKSSDFTFDGIPFGNATDVPSPADFDGDGKADVNVYRSTEGIWYRLNSGNGAFSATPFGLNGDIPVPADYDGDGKDDISLFRPSNGSWYRLNSSNGSFYAAQFGQNGDKPLVGDFDGDAKADLTIYRNGVWYIFYSTNSSFSGLPFGNSTDIPTPADFDGDGKTDLAVYRNGQWFIINSSNGSFLAFPFGLTGDKPTPSYYIQ